MVSLTGCGGTSIGEEISGLYSFLLLFLALRLSDEEEAVESASRWPLTRLIIFLAAEEKKRNELTGALCFTFTVLLCHRKH